MAARSAGSTRSCAPARTTTRTAYASCFTKRSRLTSNRLIRYSFPVTILPETTELEAVCTIFETLNRTGKPLTPFELISARAFTGGLSLYDYWRALSSIPILEDFEIEPYYLLQVIAFGSVLSQAQRRACPCRGRHRTDWACRRSRYGRRDVAAPG